MFVSLLLVNSDIIVSEISSLSVPYLRSTDMVDVATGSVDSEVFYVCGYVEGRVNSVQIRAFLFELMKGLNGGEGSIFSEAADIF